MLGAQQQAVEVSLLKPDTAGIGTAALRARGGLRNPWLHEGSPVCRLDGISKPPRPLGALPMFTWAQRLDGRTGDYRTLTSAGAPKTPEATGIGPWLPDDVVVAAI